MLKKTTSTKKVEAEVKVERRFSLLNLSLNLSLNLPFTLAGYESDRSLGLVAIAMAGRDALHS